MTPTDSRTKLRQFSWYVLLSGCVLPPEYGTDQRWEEALPLTVLGESVVSAARESEGGLSAPPLHLACFLMWDFDLIEPSFDFEMIQGLVGEYMAKGQILWPNNVGREAHDLAAELFPEAMNQLNNEESTKLLRILTPGVYQVGHILVGPLGVNELDFARMLRPRAQVPGYLCDDTGCFEQHPLLLETYSNADVNVALSAVSFALRRIKAAPALDRTALLTELVSLGTEGPTLFDAISDGLTLPELRSVVRHAYSEAQGSTRAIIREVLGHTHGDVGEVIDQNQNGELLQVLLNFPDNEIERWIDSAIRNGELNFGDSELRAGRVSRNWGGGRGIKAEISRLGLRFNRTRQTPASRLMDLLNAIYFEGEEVAPDDLAFALDVPLPAVKESLLGLALANGSFRDVARTTLLSNRQVAESVGTRLGICDWQSMSREERVDVLTWKLGADLPVDFVELDRVIEYASQLEVGIERLADETDLRGPLANLFTSVEDALKRSLTFATWALSTDHSSSHAGFVYDPDMGSQTLSFIEKNSPTEDPTNRLKLEGKNNFIPLVSGYSRLASALASDILESVAGKSVERTAGRRERTVFRSAIVFGDLSNDSQERVLEALRQMNRAMSMPVVAKVRNATLHGDNEWPSVGDFREGLAQIRKWVTVALDSGLYPTVFALNLKQEDEFGRGHSHFESRYGRVSLSQPQWYRTDRMPSNAKRMVMLPIASLGLVGPLRFKIKMQGDESRWLGYPKRCGSDEISAAGDVNTVGQSAENSFES